MNSNRNVPFSWTFCFALSLWLSAVSAYSVPIITDSVPAVIIAETDDFKAQRRAQYAIVELKAPHRLLSTSRFNGGQQQGVRYVVNHQSMESSGDTEGFETFLSMSSKRYHGAVAEQLAINPQDMVLMGTSASMNRLAHVSTSYRDLRVDAFVTAGVAGNATRAGDKARWYQGEQGNQLAAYHGTINIALLINKPLTPAAQARAVSLLVEAKSSVLTELAVPSKVSSHIATGTGTDQYVVATILNDHQTSLESASSHVKLGELIGVAVRQATREALRWQNGLEPSSTARVVRALGRFGLDEDQLFSLLQQQLPDQAYQLLEENRHSLLSEPRVVAAAYAYAAVLDRLQFGTLSPLSASEVLRDQAASAAVALSMRPDQWSYYWRAITVDADKPANAFASAMALGWQDKWQGKWPSK